MNPAAPAMTESGRITIAQITTIGIVTMYCVGQVKAAIVALARAYEAKLAADTRRTARTRSPQTIRKALPSPPGRRVTGHGI